MTQKSSQCVSILSICEEEMKILAIFLRHANLKRKRSSENKNFSESPEYFKMRKLVSPNFWFLREKNCNTCLFHQKRNFIQIFYQGHFNLFNWTLRSQVKNFNRKPEGNFENCSAVGDHKTWSWKIVFLFNGKNFHTGSKNKVDKLHKF